MSNNVLPDPLPISFQTDSANFDAFARLRVSNPITVFDSKQIHNNGSLYWDDQQVSGVSTTSVWTQNEASTILGVAASIAGKRVRQTYMRFNYQTGKSQMILMTGVINKSGGGTGITRGFFFGEDNNGIGIYDNEGVLTFVKRSKVTGSVVDTDIVQSSWNLDKLDGTGASGITLDASKAQILIIDFEWLGVGRVRIGFVIAGIPIYAHQFLHSNIVTQVYMSTPNLPVRYWIENDGTGVASTLEHICCTVISEGGIQELGSNLSQATEDLFISADVAGITYAVFGIRLKAANLDAIIKLINIMIMNATNDNYHWELIHNPTLAAAVTWVDSTDSSIQYAAGDVVGSPSITTVTGGRVTDSGYVKSGASSGSLNTETTSQLRIGSAIDGTRDELWLCVIPLTANADIYGGISWNELS